MENNKWIMVQEEVYQDRFKYGYPFANRDYRIFSFLAGVRQRQNIKPISYPRGLPCDSEFLTKKIKEPIKSLFVDSNYVKGGFCTEKEILENSYYHDFSYLTLAELLTFGYERFAIVDVPYQYTLPCKVILDDDDWSFTEYFKEDGTSFYRETPNEFTRPKTYREYLGDFFFEELNLLKSIGDPSKVRIVFWFNS